MKLQHVKRVEILYYPPELKDRIISLGAVESTRPNVKYEIDVESNVRNRDGYRTALLRDLMALKSDGAVLDVILTAEGQAALARGKKIDNRPEAQQDPNPSSTPAEIESAKAGKHPAKTHPDKK